MLVNEPKNKINWHPSIFLPSSLTLSHAIIPDVRVNEFTGIVTLKTIGEKLWRLQKALR
jgi:hypothetical protein